MKILIYQNQNGDPVVTIEGDPDDSPLTVARAYLETQKILKEGETK